MIYHTLSIGSTVYTQYRFQCSNDNTVFTESKKWQVLAVGPNCYADDYVSLLEVLTYHKVGGPDVIIVQRKHLYSSPSEAIEANQS